MGPADQIRWLWTGGTLRGPDRPRAVDCRPKLSESRDHEWTRVAALGSSAYDLDLDLDPDAAAALDELDELDDVDGVDESDVRLDEDESLFAVLPVPDDESDELFALDLDSDLASDLESEVAPESVSRFFLTPLVSARESLR